MTKEQQSILDKYSKAIYTASQHNYARAMSKVALTELQQVYQEVTGEEYKLNYNCASCVLTFLKRVALIYKPTQEENIVKSAKKTNKKRR